MFKETEVERKLKEIDLLINMQINLFPCKASDNSLWQSLDSLGTKNVSSTLVQCFFGSQHILAEEIW